MKKYEYVKVDIQKFMGSRSENHREIIDEYAAKGYRYVGYIPVEMTGHGQILEMGLVFESEEQHHEKGSFDDCFSTYSWTWHFIQKSNCHL